MPKNQNRKTLFPTIHWKALLAASLRAFVLFVIIDISLEYAIASLFAVNVKALMPRQDFGTLFLIAYYGIIWGGLFILLLSAVVSRPLFGTTWKSAVGVGLAFYLFTGLIMLQLTNLGLLPGQIFLLMGASNGIELPLVLWMGIGTYSNAAPIN